MGRIAEEDRIEIVNEHIGHYTQWNAMAGGPFEIEPAVGIAQIIALRDLYQSVQDLVGQLLMQLVAARATRDSLFGTNSELDEGVWFRIKMYKNMVRARLGPRHPLTRTVPNIGNVLPQNYLGILKRFSEHWTLVNAEPGPDVTLGTFTLANLQTAHAAIEAKITEIDALEMNLRLRREEREQLFGDEPDDVRLPGSIVAKLLIYHAVVIALNPNQPIADSLPDLFPDQSGPAVPDFPFNYVAQAGGVLKVFFAIAGIPLDAVVVFLREGAEERTALVDFAAPGGTQVILFPGITLVDDLDELELRDGDGATVARGVRDPSLPEPT